VHLVGFTTEIYYDMNVKFICSVLSPEIPPQQFILKYHQFRDTKEKLLILFIVSINERFCMWKNFRILLHHTENHTSVLEFCINFNIFTSYRKRCSEIAQHISNDNARRQIQCT